MSRFDYHVSQEIAVNGYPFYAIIMTAMRQADTANLETIKQAWPSVWEELQARYNAPMGLLPGEIDYSERTG